MTPTKKKARGRKVTPRMVQQVLDVYGMSSVEFSECVVLRAPRTVQRWVNGTSPVPREVAAFLRAVLAGETPTRQLLPRA